MKSLSDKGKEKCSIWSSLWFLPWKGLACPSSGAVNREGNWAGDMCLQHKTKGRRDKWTSYLPREVDLNLSGRAECERDTEWNSGVPHRARASRCMEGDEWLTDSSRAQLGLTVKGKMGASGLPTWLAKEPPGAHSCLGKEGGKREGRREGTDDVMGRKGKKGRHE